MSVMEVRSRAKQQFKPWELGEFLAVAEDFGLDIEEEDGEYAAYGEYTGMRTAYFTETPTEGPAGGWILLEPNR